MNPIEINNLNIWGLKESQIAAGYPRAKEQIGIMDFDKIKPELLKKLFAAQSGSGHDCAAKGVVIQFDLTAPEYFWRQLDRYHFIDHVSSQSKMHCIKLFPIKEMCNDQVDDVVINNLNRLIQIDAPLRKILSNTPCGLMMTSRMTTNLLQLKTILLQRRYHQLPEWQEFVDFIISLFTNLGFLEGEE